jgi:two-component system sensor histidine kinase PilS (NtrC family)
MSSEEFQIKPSWLLTLRLTTYILIAGIVIFWMKYPGYLGFPFFAYSFLTLLLPVILILRRWLETRALLRAVQFLQTISEVIVEAGIIYTTGSIHSAFSGLFVLTIISAALANNLAGTLIVASIVSAVYAFTIWFGLVITGDPGSSSRALETIFTNQDAAFYNIFLHILTFYLVAFVSGFLAERIRRKEIQLASTSRALKQAKLDTDDILRHLNSGVLTIDRDRKIIFFNRAAEEILGYKENDVRGRDFQDVFLARMPVLAENLQDVLLYGRHFPRNEIPVTFNDGRIIPLGISTSILNDEENNIRGVIAIFQDLTETKQMEEKIRMSDRMAAVGELSAAIAHEIRNPLAAISGSAEILCSELPVADENRRLMELIVKESVRLNNILSDFLLYARSYRPVFNRIELCRLASDVFELIRHHPSYHDKINLRLSAAESYMYIFGDEDKIKQVLLNLVVNAVESIENRPGEINIYLKQNAENSVSLQVIDNGPGIAPNLLPRIFDPFYSTKKNGTGLGLAIVQRLSESLNIELSVATHPGKGTAFILQFNQFASEPEKSSASAQIQQGIIS